MQYMARDKIFFYWIFVVSLLFIYFFLVFFVFGRDYVGVRLTLENHFLNLSKNGKNIEGLVLGGSNGYYGLSAGQISQVLGYRFYNLSLSSEGYGFYAYNQLIDDVTDRYIDRKKIRKIFYSSVLPLRIGAIDEYKKTINRSVWGGAAFGLRRHRSVFEDRRLIFSSQSLDSPAYPLPDFSGDIDFSTATCIYNKREDFEIESTEKIVNFLYERYLFLKKQFPLAEIFFVIPSEFYFYGFFSFEARNNLATSFSKKFSEKARLIIQESIPSVDFVCNERHHVNFQGRQWRTDELLKQHAKMIIN